MPTPFIMPKMDMDQESVFIVEWLKEEGEHVEKGEPVIVIETDKITSEVEAPATGTLSGVLYGENVEAPVTEVIAYILQEGESEADLPETEVTVEPEKTVEKKEQECAQSEEPASKSATPLAARMAKENELDLSKISPKGEKITKADIESYLAREDQVEPRVKTPATPAARRLASESGILIEKIEGSGPRGRVQAQDVVDFMAEQRRTAKPSGVAPVPGQTTPLSNIRKRIGDRLQASYQETPHIFLTFEVDMHEAEASRMRMNSLAEEEGAEPISVTAYLIRVLAWVLERHPMLNSSLTEDGIMLYEDINVGVATAIDEGLIVPVIHKAKDKSIREINQRLRYLTKKAREGALTREEVQDGTFTISNLGMYGIQSFTAIINPPQTAILAVGALKRKPVVIDQDDTIAVRPMMMLTLGVDHRVIDGAVAAEFLAALAKALEVPEVILF